MRGREGVVDVEVAERREPLDHRRVVLFLAAEEAGVLEDRDIAGPERRDRRVGALPVDVAHLAAEDVGIGTREHRQRRVRVRHALGPAEMREDQHDRAAVGEFGDGRQRRTQPGVVGDGAIRHRDVEVFADQHALAADLTHVVERLEGLGHGLFLHV